MMQGILLVPTDSSTPADLAVSVDCKALGSYKRPLYAYVI